MRSGKNKKEEKKALKEGLRKWEKVNKKGIENEKEREMKTWKRKKIKKEKFEKPLKKRQKEENIKKKQ